MNIFRGILSFFKQRRDMHEMRVERHNRVAFRQQAAAHRKHTGKYVWSIRFPNSMLWVHGVTSMTVAANTKSEARARAKQQLVRDGYWPENTGLPIGTVVTKMEGA